MHILIPTLKGLKLKKMTSRWNKCHRAKSKKKGMKRERKWLRSGRRKKRPIHTWRPMLNSSTRQKPPSPCINTCRNRLSKSNNKMSWARSKKMKRAKRAKRGRKKRPTLTWRPTLNSLKLQKMTSQCSKYLRAKSKRKRGRKSGRKSGRKKMRLTPTWRLTAKCLTPMKLHSPCTIIR